MGLSDASEAETPIETRIFEVKKGLDGAMVFEPVPPEAPRPKEAEEKPKRKAPVGHVKPLPESFPVEPLGVNGDIAYYLDSLRQLRDMKPSDHSRLGLMALMGKDIEMLWKNFPRVNDEGDVIGWRPEQVAESLMCAAAGKGVMDVASSLRGRGAWRGNEGELIFHCGSSVWTSPNKQDTVGKWYKPGKIGDYVYPGAPAVKRPADYHVESGETGAGFALLEMLKTWNFRRGESDARLMLGWVGAALIGGALKWRPLAWITGGKGTGKSTIHELLGGLMGNLLLRVADTTAAGISQQVGYSTLPVALDELEASEDNRKANSVIELARLAASGALKLRGGQDHKSVIFQVRSCFLFSSILVPPLTGQDRSRMAILELNELEIKKPLNLEPKALDKMGRELLRRMSDQWERFSDTQDVITGVMKDVGYSARSCDQFGTLLTCADLLLHDSVPSAEDARRWVSDLVDSRSMEEEENEQDQERCLSHLLSSQVDMYRKGERETVGDWVVRAAGMGPVGTNVEDANRLISGLGLKVVRGGLSKTNFLAVANYHQGLSGIYANTHWAGKSGTMGVWVQSLRNLTGAAASKKPVYFGGKAGRCTLIPISTVIPEKVPSYDDSETIEGV